MTLREALLNAIGESCAVAPPTATQQRNFSTDPTLCALLDAAMRAEIPVRQGREHGMAMLGIARQHCIQRVLVIADELGPAAHAAVEIVEADDARQRIEAAQGRVALTDGAPEVVEPGI